MATEIKKPELIVKENASLINEALGLMTASRQRALSKVVNPVIKREMQLELDRIAECRRAVNSLM